MPGLYAFRSSSSSSSTIKPIPSHQRHTPASAGIHAPSGLIPPPTASNSIPTFQKSAKPSLTMLAASAQPICAPQAADPSVETACARHEDSSALNYSSSGSPHEPSSVCLVAMVHEFLEEDLVVVGSCGRARCNCVDGVCGGEERCIPDTREEPQMPDQQLSEILEGITSCTSRPELQLLVDVAHATEAETEELLARDGVVVADRLRRQVMKCLREEGYNAAICKSRWKHSDGVPAGDYEYIDVLVDDKGGSKKLERFIVDIDFKAQFEIARASKQYTQLLGVLPRLYVGRAERLRQILKIMSNAAKRSLKDQGLLLPPWRKYKYMQAKWLASYRRTTNTEPVQSPHPILGLGLRAPTILSLDLTEGMDLLFYKAQLRGNEHKREAPAPTGDLHVTLGGVMTRANGCSDHDVCTAVCTDWQLPALND